MPNKIAPTTEEAKELFKKHPSKKLKDWANEWGVSVERVRQIKVEAGIKPMSEIDYDIVEIIIEKIKHEGYTYTQRDTYKNTPIGFDRFKTWCIKDPSIKEEVDKAREHYLSSDKDEKKCYRCEKVLPISEYDKSQKYKDGLNRYFKTCHTYILDNKDEEKKKTCLMCKKTLSQSSFDKSRTFKDGLTVFCKKCKSNERRSKRALTQNLNL